MKTRVGLGRRRAHMPSLDFKGKQFVYTHHLTVPFRELVVDAKKSLPAKGKPSMDDNLIIHGDNLHALKALLPRYAGKVKCIYIDPPYNTGNEGWCYNDNVRSPLMNEWVKNGNPVEREDMERHDKWLSMMWPRLQLLRELLSNTGVIFISIDDNEVQHLKCLMDEVFGADNFLTQIVWKKRAGGGSDNRHFVSEFEYMLVYCRQIDALDSLWVEYSEQELERFAEKDEQGEFYLKALERPIALGARPNLQYPIHAPDGSTIETRSDGIKYTWVVGRTRFEFMRDSGEIVFKKTRNEEWRVFRKVYKGEKTPRSLWAGVAYNRDANQEQKDLLGGGVFDHAKPSSLIKYVLSIGADKEAIILDSFAGSGTTAHAVLAVNKEDGGNRKFILVECEDYANKVTAERVRRVIKGGRTARDENLKQGLGGSFTYCTLGQELNIETLLKGDRLPDFETLARYVFYTATGQTLEKVAKLAKDFFIGETDMYRVHLIYKPDREFLRSGASALNSELVERIAAGNKSKKKALVFATAKFMGQRELSEQRIEFAQLPYAIYRALVD
jgi:adenine-specific DNA-methyltransferase